MDEAALSSNLDKYRKSGTDFQAIGEPDSLWTYAEHLNTGSNGTVWREEYSRGSLLLKRAVKHIPIQRNRKGKSIINFSVLKRELEVLFALSETEELYVRGYCTSMYLPSRSNSN